MLIPAMDLEHVVLLVVFLLIVEMVLNSSYIKTYSYKELAAIGLAMLGLAKVMVLGKKGTMTYWYGLGFAVFMLIATTLVGSSNHTTFWWSAIVSIVGLVVDAGLNLYWYMKGHLDTSRNVMIIHIIGSLVYAVTLGIAVWH